MAARPQAGEPTLKRFGITLSNRGILLGLTTVPKLLALADTVEACPPMDCVWAGDALFVNLRLDAFTLLASTLSGIWSDGPPMIAPPFSPGFGPRTLRYLITASTISTAIKTTMMISSRLDRLLEASSYNAE
jgi:hypothetical protein